MARFFDQENANVHRGVHFLSERATAAYEGARERVRRFLNAKRPREIVFVRGTTEAHQPGRLHLRRASASAPGDEVLITAMEHHSNIVPWQMLCQEKGAKLVVAPIDDRGELLVDELEKLIGPRTRTRRGDARVERARDGEPGEADRRAGPRAGASRWWSTGRRARPHVAVDVQELGCDFYAFSGHKIYGPTGIGVLYGKAGAPRGHAARGRAAAT